MKIIDTEANFFTAPYLDRGIHRGQEDGKWIIGIPKLKVIQREGEEIII